MAYHITKYGARKCSTTPEKCPVGGVHYSCYNTAETSFLKQVSEDYPMFSKLKNNSNVINITPQYYRGYVGSSVLQEEVAKFEEVFHNTVDNSVEYAKNRVDRDGGTDYHVTLLTPQETRLLKKQKMLKNFLVDCENVENALTTVGLGTVVDGDNQAWFIVCDCPNVDKIREKYGLGVKDYHITLGFIKSDIHNQFKGRETLIG